MRKIFVTGIDTGIGKTVVSAVLTEALKADYWKPVQAGDLENTDTMTVKKLTSNSISFFHQEQFRLKHPMSPHAAADLENINISLSDFSLPETTNTLVIEGAGGLLVPLNNEEMILDLIKKLDAEAVLVIKNYLGSINHSLLSAEVLKQRKIKVTGIIFCGDENRSSEDVITKYTQLPVLGRIEKQNELNPESIRRLANKFETI